MSGEVECALAYEGLIFDCDGVLVDSEKLHAETWLEVFRRHGVDITREEFDRYIGNTSPQLIAHLKELGRLGDHLDTDRMIEERRVLFYSILDTRLEEVPGACAFLDEMAGRSSIAMATSNVRETIDRVLRVMGWGETFRCTVGVGEGGNPKPAPDIYLHALERLGLPAEKCVVFEDSVPGVQAARAAGIDVIGISTGVASEILMAHGARATVPDFSDRAALMDLLERR